MYGTGGPAAQQTRYATRKPALRSLGPLFRTWACYSEPGQPRPRTGQTAHMRDRGFTCGTRWPPSRCHTRPIRHGSWESHTQAAILQYSHKRGTHDQLKHKFFRTITPETQHSRHASCPITQHPRHTQRPAAPRRDGGPRDESQDPWIVTATSRVAPSRAIVRLMVSPAR